MSYSSTSNVPIEMLPGLGMRTAKVLRSLSIGTVGQFKQLPERVLVELFGPSIRPVCQTVRGEFHVKKHYRQIKPVHSPTRFSASLSFIQKIKLASTVLSL